jgi:predicted RNase H-like HicB family nuclease
MEAKTYQFSVVYEQDEDGVYIADVPSLPGCHSFGSTLEEAERNIQEAIEGYLEVLQRQGRPIPLEEEAPFLLKKPTYVTIST